LAFTADSIEVRLVINGNLIQAMVMPRLSLITSKSDVFFATTAPEFFSLRGTRMDHKDSSPPSSPHCKKIRIFHFFLNLLFEISLPKDAIVIKSDRFSFVIFFSTNSFAGWQTVPSLSDPVEQSRGWNGRQLRRDARVHHSDSG
jgi:hypothetical protein